MTRKRYTKLLMSHGVSRNRANELAHHARSRGNYEEGYKMWLLVNGIGNCADFDKIADACSKAAMAIGELARSVLKAIKDIAQPTFDKLAESLSELDLQEYKNV